MTWMIKIVQFSFCRKPPRIIQHFRIQIIYFQVHVSYICLKFVKFSLTRCVFRLVRRHSPGQISTSPRIPAPRVLTDRDQQWVRARLGGLNELGRIAKHVQLLRCAARTAAHELTSCFCRKPQNQIFTSEIQSMNKKDTSVYISKHSQTLILYGISERLRQA